MESIDRAEEQVALSRLEVRSDGVEAQVTAYEREREHWTAPLFGRTLRVSDRLLRASPELRPAELEPHHNRSISHLPEVFFQVRQGNAFVFIIGVDALLIVSASFGVLFLVDAARLDPIVINHLQPPVTTLPGRFDGVRDQPPTHLRTSAPTLPVVTKLRPLAPELVDFVSEVHARLPRHLQVLGTVEDSHPVASILPEEDGRTSGQRSRF